MGVYYTAAWGGLHSYMGVDYTAAWGGLHSYMGWTTQLHGGRLHSYTGVDYRGGLYCNTWVDYTATLGLYNVQVHCM